MTARPLLVIGTRNYSSWSLRPWLLLRHHDVAFDEVCLPLNTAEFAAGVALWSPSRRMPALQHGDLSVWDSLAICEYVSETFLGGAGWPADSAARATARSVSAEMHSGFQALRGGLPMNCRRRATGFVADAAAQRDIARICELWRDCRARFCAGGDFLFGTFSIADAMYAPVASRFVTYAIALDADARAYVDALFALPAMREWLDASAAETHALPGTDKVG